MKKTKVIILILLSIILGDYSLTNAQSKIVSTEQEPFTLGTLSKFRNEIVFQEYTPEEKQLLANQALLVLDELYVNRHIKNALLGNDIDASIQIHEIAENAQYMTTEELQRAISSVFFSQRDGHLDFFFPPPHACYFSILPIRLAEIYTPDSAHKIVVKSLRTLPIQMERVPKIGDELIAYNGKNIENAIEEEIMNHGGTNDSGGYALALNTLTLLDHRIHLVPKSDQVSLTFKTTEGEIYELTVPWTVQRDNACVVSFLERNGQYADEYNSESEDPLTPLSSNDYVRSLNGIEKKYNERDALASFIQYPTSLSDLTWGIIENTNGLFGYIKLKSFMLRGYEADIAFNEIVNIIIDEMSDTDGLIIDVRDNGGGTIDLADRLPQLFAPTDVSIQGARLLNTELNSHVLNDSFLGKWPTTRWADLINEVSGEDYLYTRTAQFTDDALANTYGQIYFSPVAVMMNANTFSAAELFVAAMKDNGLATIFGEDVKTGGGGAHVMTHSEFVSYVGEPFITLPNNQEMRFAWRQFVRKGKNSGMLIEELGIGADRRIRPTLNDLLNQGEGQIKKITKELAWQKYEKSSFIRFKHPHRQDYSIDDISLNATIGDTDYVKLNTNNHLIKKLYVNAWKEKDVNITIPRTYCKIGDVLNIELQGIDYGDQVWRVKKKLNILGHKIAPDLDGEVFDFSNSSDVDPFAVVNIKPWINSTPENGWNVRNGSLGIGDGIQYKRNVKSDLSLMLDLRDRNSTSLSFTVDVKVEKGFDYVEIYATSGDDRIDLDKLTGTLPLKTYTYDLNEFSGKDNVGLHFLFFSDGYGTDRGVEIYEIGIF